MNKIVVATLIILLGLSSISAHGDSFITGTSPDSQTDPLLAPKHFSVILREEIGVAEDKGYQNDAPKSILHKIILEEKMGLDHNSISDEIVAAKDQSDKKAIMERIFDRKGISEPEWKASSLDAQYDYGVNSEFKSGTTQIPNFEANSQPLIQPLVGYQTALIEFPSESINLIREFQNEIDSFNFENSLLDVDNPTLLLIILPFAGFVLLRSENENIKFYNFTKLFCYLFIVILLSSGVITPLSISSSYWPHVYAQEFDESISVVPSSETKTNGKPADTPDNFELRDCERADHPVVVVFQHGLLQPASGGQGRRPRGFGLQTVFEAGDGLRRPLALRLTWPRLAWHRSAPPSGVAPGQPTQASAQAVRRHRCQQPGRNCRCIPACRA